jgi:hypothetical protein
MKAITRLITLSHKVHIKARPLKGKTKKAIKRLRKESKRNGPEDNLLI